MDPDEDAPLPMGNAFQALPMFRGGPLDNAAPPVGLEDPPPINNNRSSVPSRSSCALCLDPDRSSTRSSHTHSTPILVILRISPSHVGSPTGFIYFAINKLKDQAAIIAYFDYAGRGATILPCHGFDEFLASTPSPLHTSTMGQCILEENASLEDIGPDLSWLPGSPLMSLAMLLFLPSMLCPLPQQHNDSRSNNPCPSLFPSRS